MLFQSSSLNDISSTSERRKSKALTLGTRPWPMCFKRWKRKCGYHRKCSFYPLVGALLDDIRTKPFLDHKRYSKNRAKKRWMKRFRARCSCLYSLRHNFHNNFCVSIQMYPWDGGSIDKEKKEKKREEEWMGGGYSEGSSNPFYAVRIVCPSKHLKWINLIFASNFIRIAFDASR